MWKQFRKIEKGEFLLFAVDTATGGGDRTACQVFSKNRLDVPMVFHSEITTTDFIPSLVSILEQVSDYTGVHPLVALERNNGGAFLMDRIAELNFSGKYQLFKMPNRGRENPAEAVKYGYETNSATRKDLLASLQGAINKRLLKIYDKETIKECLSFIVVKTSSSWRGQAESGAHDDLVMSLGIAWQLKLLSGEPITAKELKNYEQYENYQQPTNNKFGGFKL